MIHAVIVDDEEISRKTLNNLLAEYFPDIQVTALAATVAEGEKQIKAYRPGLVFLDIAMPDGDGFSVLEKTKHLDYYVVFVTAYHDYAIKAFEFSALHYLLKPINVEELEQAVGRYTLAASKNYDKERFEILQQGLQNNIRKIALPTNDSILFVELDDIIRCEASHNYTVFHFRNGQTAVMSKSLHNYEKLLGPNNFLRVHDKHLVNMRYVTKYIRGKGGYTQLHDGSEIEVSVRRKEEFLKKMALQIPKA